jgi:hypothetical protein
MPKWYFDLIKYPWEAFHDTPNMPMLITLSFFTPLLDLKYFIAPE